MAQDPSTVGLNLPDAVDLPFFAYGLFKPNELAHQQIQKFINGEPATAYVRGALWIRDGLPLLKPDGPDIVSGYLLHFRNDNAGEAYGVISRFEPKEQYYWEEIALGSPKGKANVLVGRKPEVASIKYDGGEWSCRHDPVFTFGLDIVREAADKFGNREFRFDPPDSFDWPRLFRLQMAYLLLWSAIERYASLCYGPQLDPMEKLKRLGGDPAFMSALRQEVTRTERVYDSRDPDDHADLNPQCGISSAKYYYFVRNNLSHRGKGTWKDGEIIRQSLNELCSIFRLVLKKRLSLDSPE